MFGLACPTTIYTLGLFLWPRGMPRYATIVPVLWVLPGTIAAVQLGVREDLLLGASLGVCAVVLASRYDSHEESDRTLSKV